MSLSKKAIKEDKFKKIELEFPVETVVANQIPVWPFLRHYYSFSFNKIIVKNRPKFSLVQGIISMFYGWPNWFGSYKYLHFSDSLERKYIKGKWFDKSLDYIGEVLGSTLLFEFPLPRHYKKREIFTKNACSKLPLYGLVWLYSILILRRIKVENQEILESIKREFDCDIDYKSLVKKNLAQIAIGKWLIKVYQPRAIFIQCFYTNMGFVKAFRDADIPVIEIQHGIIAPHHGAYNVYKQIENSFYPDYIFTFGEREFEVLSPSNYFIDQKRVKPVGHFYIDFLNTEYSGDRRLKEMLKKYRFSVTISSQDIIEEEELIKFLIKTAQLTPDTLFLFFPRLRPQSDYEKFNFPSNLIFTPWLNVYEAMVHTDFHSTMHSTCAIEAPSLGARNILININGLSKKYYSNLLNNTLITFNADTPEEFISCLNKPQMRRTEIMNGNKYFINTGYKKNVEKALQEILWKENLEVK